MVGGSSTQAGAKVRAIYRRHAATCGYPEPLALGHFGTLDPDATGVLPLALGKATRLLPFLSDRRKTYRFTLMLGTATDSGDASGAIVREAAIPDDAAAQLRSVLHTFHGELTQTPPMYSALRHRGRRLYEYARAGIEIERPARRIVIEHLAFIETAQDEAAGYALRVRCSEGTYIRTLCEDLANAIGTVGHMGSLLREAAGPFTLEESRSLEEIAENPIEALLVPSRLLPLPHLALAPTSVRRFCHGEVLPLKEAAAIPTDERLGDRPYLILTPGAAAEHRASDILGVAEIRDGRLCPRVVFPEHLEFA